MIDEIQLVRFGNPGTGDETVPAVIVSVAAMICAGVTMTAGKKRRKNSD
ncbi:MAG: hypothetical protein J6Z80_06655 [Clostridia bacterium]|nr:hypothetical protein [Clostridia bacterium]